MNEGAAMTETLSHWGRAHLQIQDGTVTGVQPVADDPAFSRISENFIGTITGKMRILQPMVRQGWLNGDGGTARGEDAFVAVTWDRAVELVAAQLTQTIADHGNDAIFGGSYGWASAGRFHHAQSQLHRFLNVMGGYTRSVNTHSHAALEVALPHIIGSQMGMGTHHTPWELIVGHTKLFVAFGGLPLKNAQVSAGGVSRHKVGHALSAARQSGTHFVNIGPLRDDMDEALGAEWIAPRPNSDLALMLALAFVLDTEGLADTAFLARFTSGYDRFRAYIRGDSDGQPKSPDWAAANCGLPAAQIADLARRMAGTRTMISAAWSLQRAAAGEQIAWAVVSLAAMLGQIGLPGGGFGFGYGAANRVGNIELPFNWPTFPQGPNPVSRFIPVARLADMLEHPGASFDYDGGQYRYPDTRLIWWAGGNPFHHQQDLNRLHRLWKRPDCVIVQEPHWNAIARHADIVLPCTLPPERNDIGIAKAEPHIIAMKKQLSPLGEALDDFDILRRIASRLGREDAFTESRNESDWLRWLYAGIQRATTAHGHALPDFEEFWRRGEYRFDPGIAPCPLLSAFREDPIKNALSTPSGRIEIFSEKVASFGYTECPGHAQWTEPEEWLGSAPKGALHLISNQPAHRLHSQLDHGAFSRSSKVNDREIARIHPDEAASRGLHDGETVLIRSSRGRLLATLRPDPAVMPGVLQMATGAWLDLDADGLDRHGNVNVLTRDAPTSRLAQAPTAHTTLVFINKFAGKPPLVRAFQPPHIVQDQA